MSPCSSRGAPPRTALALAAVLPIDNPFGDAVFAYGLRNAFGIAFNPSGTLLVTNNGPSGDAGTATSGYDTVTRVVRGGAYQWPYCYGYDHVNIGGGYTGCGGEQSPDWSSEAPPAIVPTGATWVDAAGPSGYAGHFVFCAFADGRARIFTPGSPHASVTLGAGGCALAIVQGPDHALYLADSGHITRLG